MTESQSTITLDDRNEVKSGRSCGTETFSLKLDILGKPACFCINVANAQARLSDMVPLARTLSTKLVMAMLDRLSARGKCVACRKGCSACCSSYLVPLSVPEAFRLAEELSAMPASEGRTLMQSSLDTARIILDHMPMDFKMGESEEANNGIWLRQLGDWYAGLGLACPFLSDGLCVLYEQRPMACREYLVTRSAICCDAASTDEPDKVKMPFSVLECLGQLTAELEQSDVEAVILPLALPWAQENVERSKRTWPAVTVVKRFVEILQATAEDSASAPVAAQPGCK